MRLKKYLTVFKISWQEIFEYRVNVLIMLIVSVISLISIFYLWNNVYTNHATLMGYTKEEIITYFVLINYLLIAMYDYLPVTEEIREGRLSQYLIRPISYFFYQYSFTFAQRLFRIMAGFPVVVIILFILHGNVLFITEPINYLFLIIAAFSAINVLFLLHFLQSMLEFWVLHSGTSTFITELILFFLAGSFIPLVFLPGWIQTIAALTPFKYAGAFIIEGFMGRLSATEMLTGLGIQIFWTIALILITKFVWKKGLLRYEAFGG